MYADRSSNALSRSGPAVAVIGVHVLIAYVLSVSMGVVEVPKFVTETTAVFLPEPQKVIPEPEIPPVTPEIDNVQPIDNPMPTAVIPDEPIAPPSEVPIPASTNSITAVAAVAAAGSVAPPAQELKVSRRTEPGYPPAARRAGEEGTVRLRILVDERGAPRDVEVVKGSGFSRLDQAAIDAVRKWRFIAATNGTQAISAWTQVAVTFRLTSGS